MSQIYLGEIVGRPTELTNNKVEQRIKAFDDENKAFKAESERIKSEIDSSLKKTEEVDFSKDNLISISEDGDTLQASKAGINASTTKGALVTASEDGAVTQIGVNKEIKENEDAKEAKEDALRDTKKVTSLAGFSKQQVEQLYRQGQITRYEYDKNMEQRAEREEKMNTSTVSEEEVKTQMSAQEAFSKSMGIISAQAQNIANADAGIIGAYNNDRLGMVGDIFTTGS